MKKPLKIILVYGLTLICFSCYYNEFPEELEEDNTPDPEEVISFNDDIIPIFTSYKCTQCHNGNQDPDLRAGKEYSSLVPNYVTENDANNSTLYKKLAVENHRDLDISNLELAYIKEWINRGAENN